MLRGEGRGDAGFSFFSGLVHIGRWFRGSGLKVFVSRVLLVVPGYLGGSGELYRTLTSKLLNDQVQKKHFFKPLFS